MPIADTKKCQHIIDVVAEEVVKFKAVATRLEAIRTAFIAHNPSTVGTPLDGNVATISAWVDSVRTAANSAVPNGFLAAKSSRHRSPTALGEDI